MVRTKGLGLILLAGTALAGPPEVDATPSVDADPAEEPAVDEGEPRVVAMHRHLGMVQIMHDAVVAGDLHAAREAAHSLAEPRVIQDMPGAWAPWMAVMRESAGRASGDWSHTDAARTVTEVGRSCGSCHAFTAGGPLEPSAEPPEGFSQHAWAASSMWMAIVNGDEGGFRAAGEILKKADLGKVSKKQAAVFRQLATRATHAHSRAVMADTYGELLGTCASCHESLRD